MAEPSPGQVITPGESPEPPKEPAQPAQEVSVDLSRQSAAPLPSSNTVPTPPQHPQPVAVPTPPPPSPAIATPAILSDTHVEDAQDPPQIQPQPITAVPVQPDQSHSPPESGFAPELMNEASMAVPGGESNGYYEESTADTISWTASEYIAHHKSTSWYFALAGITLLFAALVYFITGGDIISVAIVILAATVLGVYAGKKPKEQQYAISAAGVTIGAKTYSFSLLKTFSITNEGAFSSITFWPMKRFMPALSVYYDPSDEDKIIEVLSNYLPMDIQKIDAVDNFMRKIRF